MDYRVLQPAPSLAPYVHCYWLLRGRDTTAAQPVFPDGFTEIILHFGDRFRRIGDEGRVELQARSLLAGQLRRPIVLEPTGPAGVLGIRFRPGGIYHFLRFPQSEIADCILPLEDLWGPLARELEMRVLEAAGDRERVAAVEGALAARLRSDSRPTDVDWAVGQILSSQGTAAVSGLCAGLGLSGRHLTRRFEQQVGMGPKLLSRIVRFQRALRMSSDGATPWADVAAACGYFDQAHLVRDFREFTGRTPTLLRREGAEMAGHFASNPSLRA